MGTLHADPDGGFSLVESLVAMVIFLIMTAAAATAMITGNNASQTSRTRVVETNLARTELNQAVAQPTPSPTTYTVNPGGNAYTVARSVQVMPTPSATGACPTGSVRQITVNVTWAGRSVSMTTAQSC